MERAFDYVIVGGGSAGCVLANRLTTDPANRVLVLEAGRPDYLWDVFIHMPAALTYPIGWRWYDWKYESEPELNMGGRRISHARGKVLGGSSSINGMIFQRGNPLDYERWAADPGMETWDYAHCLPYFKRMGNCLAADPADGYRGHSGPLILERGPARNPLFGAFFEAVQQAGYPLTDDVNGYRQEGFAPFDRNIHRGRRLSAARAYLHPVMGKRENLEVRTRTFVTKALFEGSRAVGVEVANGRGDGADPRRRGDPGGRCHQHAPAAAALRRGPGRRPGRSRHRHRGRSVRGGTAPAGPSRGLHPVQEPATRVHAALGDAALAPAVHRRAVAVLAERTGRHEPLRGRGLRPLERRRGLPEPHVPFLAACDPLRRIERGGRPRLPGPRRTDVLGRAWIDRAQEHRPARPPGAALQLPLDRPGPARVGRGRPRRPPPAQPAG